MNAPANSANEYQGASASDIRRHYDVGNAFYRLWLDRTMTYSAALWEKDDDLSAAQLRKLDFHIKQARVHRPVTSVMHHRSCL
ncbi:MAG: class I SAM-dependent methyltransferase [Pseudomonadota bacterium]